MRESMRIPNAELAALAPAIAREARAHPSAGADAALARMLETANRRGMLGTVREVRAILETGTGPVGPAVRTDALEAP